MLPSLLGPATLDHEPPVTTDVAPYKGASWWRCWCHESHLAGLKMGLDAKKAQDKMLEV